VTPFATGKVGARRLVLYTADYTEPFSVFCDVTRTMPDHVRRADGAILTKTMDVLTVPRGD
jgi:hypothetical protein